MRTSSYTAKLYYMQPNCNTFISQADQLLSVCVQLLYNGTNHNHCTHKPVIFHAQIYYYESWSLNKQITTNYCILGVIVEKTYTCMCIISASCWPTFTKFAQTDRFTLVWLTFGVTGRNVKITNFWATTVAQIVSLYMDL